MILDAHLFHNSGHHYYFFPLGVRELATEAARSYVEQKALPITDPAKMVELARLCTASLDWMEAKSTDRKSGACWLRGKFGTKRRGGGPNQASFEILGLWCAIETNTGTRRDGYIWDLNKQPSQQDAAWVKWKKEADESTPYVAVRASNTSFEKEVDLCEAFDLKLKLKTEVGKCALKIHWKPQGGDPVPVHLIIDFGNSRTIAFGLEIARSSAQGGLQEICRPIYFSEDPDEAEDASQIDPTMTELVPASWIIMREPAFAGSEFVPPRFSWEEFVESARSNKSSASIFGFGRQKSLLEQIRHRAPHMFIELSPVVMGAEATNLLAGVDVAGGALTFLSSPKRYAWDDDPVGAGGQSYWFMHSRTGRGAPTFLKGEMFRFIPRNHQVRNEITKLGASPTEWDQESIKPPAQPTPDFPRSDSLIWTALAIVERASRQIYSERWRANSPVPRYLERVVVTFPPGWTNEEFSAYWEAWYFATCIYYWSRCSNLARLEPYFQAPALTLDLDEAIASQLAVVFSEIHHLGESATDWIDLYGRVRAGKPSVRVLTIDIGGGTLDTSVVEYHELSSRRGGVELGLEVLFGDSSTNAGDKLVKDLIEGALLPKLGERFQSDPHGKSTFERVLAASGAALTADRLRRMVITRSVFVPMVLKWLETLAAATQGFDESNLSWSPRDCGANSLQIEELNRSFRKAGLIGEAEQLLSDDTPFEPDYKKMSLIISSWIDPICERHSHYAAAFQCDLVIITGKPSELPPIRSALKNRLPLQSDRLIFASGYYAGSWFPASNNGRIPDAKMVTVIGAALNQAIKESLIPNWHLEERLNPTGAPRNYWGLLSNQSKLFDDATLVLRPDQDEAVVSVAINRSLGRARFLQNTPEPVYVLRWRDPNRRNEHAVLSIHLIRVTRGNDGTPLRTEELRLAAVKGRDASGNRVNLGDIELHLRTFSEAEGHWLDKGQFAVLWD